MKTTVRFSTEQLAKAVKKASIGLKQAYVISCTGEKRANAYYVDIVANDSVLQAGTSVPVEYMDCEPTPFRMVLGREFGSAIYTVEHIAKTVTVTVCETVVEVRCGDTKIDLALQADKDESGKSLVEEFSFAPSDSSYMVSMPAESFREIIVLSGHTTTSDTSRGLENLIELILKSEYEKDTCVGRIRAIASDGATIASCERNINDVFKKGTIETPEGPRVTQVKATEKIENHVSLPCDKVIQMVNAMDKCAAEDNVYMIIDKNYFVLNTKDDMFMFKTRNATYGARAGEFVDNHNTCEVKVTLPKSEFVTALSLVDLVSQKDKEVFVLERKDDYTILVHDTECKTISKIKGEVEGDFKTFAANSNRYKKCIEKAGCEDTVTLCFAPGGFPISYIDGERNAVNIVLGVDYSKVAEYRSAIAGKAAKSETAK